MNPSGGGSGSLVQMPFECVGCDSNRNLHGSSQ
jgi:hypothetical protein